CQHLYGTPFTF
nr:immunoglobulin light chain junction region [Macaca mulatta]